MNKEEARQFLEERDFCMTHFVKQVHAKGSRKANCPECEAEKALKEQAQIDRAIRVLRGEPAIPPSQAGDWIPCTGGTLPPVNERVWLMCLGFRDTGKAGGRETYVAGKPHYWRKR